MSSSSPLPVVAIVGRPNVGKSTLFNRILRRRQALIHPEPGMTRDRNYGEAEYRKTRFFLVDTGGYEVETESDLLIQMREQTLLAVEEADVVVFVGDVNEPDNPTDDEIIERLRRAGKPIFFAINKCDSPRRRDEAYAMNRFGFDRVYPVSALHGDGALDLLDDVIERLPQQESILTPEEVTRVAIVGRQNVGKSTLLNRLLGQDRVIANATPGTTRDAIDTYIEREGRRYCLIDTAGLRRRGKIERGIESLCALSAALAIRRCDVAILTLDATRGVHAQDTHIGGLIQQEGKPCLLAVNKWDAIAKDNSTHGAFVKLLREEFSYLPHALILTLSALTGQRCHRIWELVDFCVEQSRRRIPTADLNRVLQAAARMVSPPVFQGKNLKIKYATQTANRPPTFTLFVNDPRCVHFSYERYLINRLRADFGFEATPIRLLFRRKSPPKGWEETAREIERAPRVAGRGRQQRPTPPLGADAIPIEEPGEEFDWEELERLEAEGALHPPPDDEADEDAFDDDGEE